MRIPGLKPADVMFWCSGLTFADCILLDKWTVELGIYWMNGIGSFAFGVSRGGGKKLDTCLYQLNDIHLYDSFYVFTFLETGFT